MSSDVKAQARARAAVSAAVSAGTLVRPGLCSRCGRDAKVQGHHADYSRPLDVEWLCLPCHRWVHATSVISQPTRRPEFVAVTAHVPCDLRDRFVAAIKADDPDMSVSRRIRMCMRQVIAEHEASL